MIYKVARLGHPVLRSPSQNVSPDDVRSGMYDELIADMFESMEAHHGVGLAAPQVHLPIRLFVAQLPQREARKRGSQELPRVAFFNVTLELLGEPEIVDVEGCLSIPFLAGDVPRHNKVILQGLDPKGNEVEVTMEGYGARIFQHEVDHLDGKVYLDRMPDLETLGYTLVL